MTSLAVAPTRHPPATLLRRRPEVWVWGVAVAAWATTAVLHGTPTPAGAPHPGGHHAPSGSGSGGVEVAAALGMWALMVLAMMLPAAAPALRAVAHASLPRRRLRAQGLFVAGFVGIWVGVGVAPVVAVGVWAPDGSTRQVATVALLLLAAGYELSRHKRRALARCHLLPSPPPRGTRADRACLRAGTRQATSCVVSCGALMAALVVDGHANVALMVVVTAIVWAERLLVGRRRRLPRSVPVLVAASLALAVG